MPRTCETHGLDRLLSKHYTREKQSWTHRPCDRCSTTILISRPEMLKRRTAPSPESQSLGPRVAHFPVLNSGGPRGYHTLRIASHRTLDGLSHRFLQKPCRQTSAPTDATSHIQKDWTVLRKVSPAASLAMLHKSVVPTLRSPTEVLS